MRIGKFFRDLLEKFHPNHTVSKERIDRVIKQEERMRCSIIHGGILFDIGSGRCPRCGKFISHSK